MGELGNTSFCGMPYAQMCAPTLMHASKQHATRRGSAPMFSLAGIFHIPILECLAFLFRNSIWVAAPSLPRGSCMTGMRAPHE
eukprot:1158301-Pelagomonas_calceolata.AAC.3